MLDRANDSARHLLSRQACRDAPINGKAACDLWRNELIASFRIRRVDGSDEILTEEFITQIIAKNMSLPFLILDPLNAITAWSPKPLVGLLQSDIWWLHLKIEMMV